MSRVWGPHRVSLNRRVHILCWNQSPRNAFKVKSYYKLLLISNIIYSRWWTHNILQNTKKSYRKSLWKPKVPTKVAFILWIATLEKIQTIDNLKKWWVVVRDWCCRCKFAGETTDCLLLHGLVALELWSMVFTLFGIHWAMSRGVVKLLVSWQGRFGRCNNSVIWKVIPHYLMWRIWCKRNDKTFEGCEKSALDLKLLFLKFQSERMTASSLFSFTNTFEKQYLLCLMLV